MNIALAVIQWPEVAALAIVATAWLAWIYIVTRS